MLNGDRRALARLLTLLEGDEKLLPEVVAAVHPHVGKAYCVGVTGPPGAGKSTLVDGLVKILRGQGRSVGILLVDPSSPFSGGAVLGDRVRMRRHYLDEAVFIRSLATRGAHGGLSKATGAAVGLLDAFGTDVIFVESVGVGQTELEIMAVADTVVVAEVPEAGDSVQVMKAGLLEIGDIFVVNKADRAGASRLASAIREMVALGDTEGWWSPPVLLTQAHRRKGVEKLLEAIQEHRAAQEESSRLELRRRERKRDVFKTAVRRSVEARLTQLMASDGAMGEIVEKVEAGEIDPHSAAAQVLEDGAVASRLTKTPGKRSSGP